MAAVEAEVEADIFLASEYLVELAVMEDGKTLTMGGPTAEMGQAVEEVAAQAEPLVIPLLADLEESHDMAVLVEKSIRAERMAALVLAPLSSPGNGGTRT